MTAVWLVVFYDYQTEYAFSTYLKAKAWVEENEYSGYIYRMCLDDDSMQPSFVEEVDDGHTVRTELNDGIVA